jgi:predicted acetyltransferase
MSTTSTAVLVRPARAHLAAYTDALRRGWSPDTTLRGPKTAAEQLAAIEADADAFLASLDRRDPAGATIELPDGSRVPRLPGFVRWIWDDALAGSINLRWQPGTPELPPHVLGHIGYSVVPWKRRRGHASRALALILDEARAVGLDRVELTADLDNLASHRVIAANGGTEVGHFARPPQYGGGQHVLYRIAL